MNHALIITPSLLESLSLAGKIKDTLGCDVSTSNSLKQIQQLLDKEIIHIAVVDPFLSDDSSEEIIDLLQRHSIPAIVYTHPLKSNVLEIIRGKSIIDHVIKSSKDNSDIVVNLVNNALCYKQTKILIVNESSESRINMKETLDSLKFYTIEANSLQEALDQIDKHPEIKLVLTHEHLTDHNGIDLTREIRKKFTNKEVSIIGLSDNKNSLNSADFLRNGANDFIDNTFQKEDLVNRILIQLDTLDYINTIRNASEKDFLTNIYNRKYVYEMGSKFFANAKRGNMTFACAMIDIDHFKRVNDTYGHDIGDKVIIRLAQELSSSFRVSDIIGRLGGEEFCVILSNPNVSILEDIFNDFRQKIEKIVIYGEDEHKKRFSFGFTISIGVTSTLSESFEKMLKYSDMKLYEAKNYGRNMVVL